MLPCEDCREDPCVCEPVCATCGGWEETVRVEGDVEVARTPCPECHPAAHADALRVLADPRAALAEVL